MSAFPLPPELEAFFAQLGATPPQQVTPPLAPPAVSNDGDPAIPLSGGAGLGGPEVDPAILQQILAEFAPTGIVDPAAALGGEPGGVAIEPSPQPPGAESLKGGSGVTDPTTAEQTQGEGSYSLTSKSGVNDEVMAYLQELAARRPELSEGLALAALAFTNPELALRMKESKEGESAQARQVLGQIRMTEASANKQVEYQKGQERLATLTYIRQVMAKYPGVQVTDLGSVEEIANDPDKLSKFQARVTAFETTRNRQERVTKLRAEARKAGGVDASDLDLNTDEGVVEYERRVQDAQFDRELVEGIDTPGIRAAAMSGEGPLPSELLGDVASNIKDPRQRDVARARIRGLDAMHRRAARNYQMAEEEQDLASEKFTLDMERFAKFMESEDIRNEVDVQNMLNKLDKSAEAAFDRANRAMAQAVAAEQLGQPGFAQIKQQAARAFQQQAETYRQRASELKQRAEIIQGRPQSNESTDPLVKREQVEKSISAVFGKIAGKRGKKLDAYFGLVSQNKNMQTSSEFRHGLGAAYIYAHRINPAITPEDVAVIVAEKAMQIYRTGSDAYDIPQRPTDPGKYNFWSPRPPQVPAPNVIEEAEGKKLLDQFFPPPETPPPAGGTQ